MGIFSFFDPRLVFLSFFFLDQDLPFGYLFEVISSHRVGTRVAPPRWPSFILF